MPRAPCGTTVTTWGERQRFRVAKADDNTSGQRQFTQASAASRCDDSAGAESERRATIDRSTSEMFGAVTVKL